MPRIAADRGRSGFHLGVGRWLIFQLFRCRLFTTQAGGAEPCQMRWLASCRLRRLYASIEPEINAPGSTRVFNGLLGRERRVLPSDEIVDCSVQLRREDGQYDPKPLYGWTESRCGYWGEIESWRLSPPCQQADGACGVGGKLRRMGGCTLHSRYAGDSASRLRWHS